MRSLMTFDAYFKTEAVQNSLVIAAAVEQVFKGVYGEASVTYDTDYKPTLTVPDGKRPIHVLTDEHKDLKELEPGYYMRFIPRPAEQTFHLYGVEVMQGGHVRVHENITPAQFQKHEDTAFLPALSKLAEEKKVVFHETKTRGGGIDVHTKLAANYVETGSALTQRQLAHHVASQYRRETSGVVGFFFTRSSSDSCSKEIVASLEKYAKGGDESLIATGKVGTRLQKIMDAVGFKLPDCAAEKALDIRSAAP